MKFFDWESAKKGEVFQLHLDGRPETVMALVTQQDKSAPLILVTEDGKSLRDDEYGNSCIISATRLLLSDGTPF